MSRVLLAVRRRIESDRLTLYEPAWAKFRAAALARGAKAWRFRSSGDSELYLEFLEFAGAADPRGSPDLKQAAGELDDVAAGDVEEWEDANIQ